jgi:hypothetical protein
MNSWWKVGSASLALIGRNGSLVAAFEVLGAFVGVALRIGPPVSEVESGAANVELDEGIDRAIEGVIEIELEEGGIDVWQR